MKLLTCLALLLLAVCVLLLGADVESDYEA
jgi:hypothetical protein